MDLLLIALAVLAGFLILVALLVARGMWLIGQGTQTELDARTKMSQNTVGATGWGLLDWLRTTDFTPVRWLEDQLGLDAPTKRCRHHGCTNEAVPGYRVCHDHLEDEGEP